MKLNKFNDFFNCKVKAQITSRGKLKNTKNPAFAGFSLILTKTVYPPAPYSTANLVLAIFLTSIFLQLAKSTDFKAFHRFVFETLLKVLKFVL